MECAGPEPFNFSGELMDHLGVGISSFRELGFPLECLRDFIDLVALVLEIPFAEGGVFVGEHPSV